jgi:hypothetical protein
MHRRLCMYFMYFNMMDQSCWNTVKQSSANETNYCGQKNTKIALPNSRTNMNKLVAWNSASQNIWNLLIK